MSVGHLFVGDNAEPATMPFEEEGEELEASVVSLDPSEGNDDELGRRRPGFMPW